MVLFIFIFFKDLFIYSFRESKREAETQAKGEAGSTGSPTRDSIPGLHDQAPGRRQY